MTQSPHLRFDDQAALLLRDLNEYLNTGEKTRAEKILSLKLQIMYEMGVAAGRKYELEGIYPYTSTETKS